MATRGEWHQRAAFNSHSRPCATRAAHPCRRLERCRGLGYISSRRFGLFVLNSIERGTRWVLMYHADRNAWARVRRQVSQFLRDLAEAGAFPGAVDGKDWFVVTDERVNTEHDTLLGRISILVGFAASRPAEFHTYLITHSTAGSVVRP